MLGNNFYSIVDDTIKKGLLKGNTVGATTEGRDMGAKKEKNIKLTNQKTVDDVKKKKKCC